MKEYHEPKTITDTNVFWVDDVVITTEVNPKTGRESMHIEVNPNSKGSGDASFALYSREGPFNFEFKKKVRK